MSTKTREEIREKQANIVHLNRIDEFEIKSTTSTELILFIEHDTIILIKNENWLE